MDCWGLVSYRAGNGQRFSALLIWPRCVLPKPRGWNTFFGGERKTFCSVRLCVFTFWLSLSWPALNYGYKTVEAHTHTHTALPYRVSLYFLDMNERYLPHCIVYMTMCVCVCLYSMVVSDSSPLLLSSSLSGGWIEWANKK